MNEEWETSCWAALSRTCSPLISIGHEHQAWAGQRRQSLSPQPWLLGLLFQPFASPQTRTLIKEMLSHRKE